MAVEGRAQDKELKQLRDRKSQGKQLTDGIEIKQ